MSVHDINCPECNTKDFAIYPCGTFCWFFASEEAVKNLKVRGKKIHYAKDYS